MAVRISYTGELGWEIYMAKDKMKPIYKSLLEKGEIFIFVVDTAVAVVVAAAAVVAVSNLFWNGKTSVAKNFFCLLCLLMFKENIFLSQN